MITADRMRAVDQNAAALGIPQQQLMESSGHAIAQVVKSIVDPGDAIDIVCGRGNNGGDGFVAARFLEEYDVAVRLVGNPSRITTAIAANNWEVLQQAEINCTVWHDSAAIDIRSPDLIVDALVGTGVSGPLREPMARAVRAINESSAHVLAVDTPSGINPDTGESHGLAIKADHIITFHDIKPGLVDSDAPVTVADIGIPQAAERFVGPGDLQSFGRAPDSHKGDAGRIVVIGGGPYGGAPALSAIGAMRAGADLGIIVCPTSVADTVQSFTPDLIVQSFPGIRFDSDGIASALEIAKRADVVVLGPGIGDHPDTMNGVKGFLEHYGGRCVVDADALAVVPTVETDATLLCTPHQGELEVMGGPREPRWQHRLATLESFADDLGHTILVKGEYDIISDGTETRVNRTGNPGMTVGGTGDVLAGVCGALCANPDRSVVQSASIGAYVTGLAGDRAAERYGHGLTATDVLAALAETIWEQTDE